MLVHSLTVRWRRFEMADELRQHILIWAGVMRAAETNPGIRISCPFCAVGTIDVRDLVDPTDPKQGERLFRCTHCARSTEARISFGPEGAAFPPPAP